MLGLACGLNRAAGFPSFTSSLYSDQSWKDSSRNRTALDKIEKHIEHFGFPQPKVGLGFGSIKTWRFLTGNDPFSRKLETQKADKIIGENFGQVLHWLICSASTIPSDMAVIVYHSQHISLARYFGDRFGCKILNAAQDLDLSGSHQLLNERATDIFKTWAVIVSPKARIKRTETELQKTVLSSPQSDNTKAGLKVWKASARRSVASLQVNRNSRSPSMGSIMYKKARSFTISSNRSVKSLASSLSSLGHESCRTSMDKATSDSESLLRRDPVSISDQASVTNTTKPSNHQSTHGSKTRTPKNQPHLSKLEESIQAKDLKGYEHVPISILDPQAETSGSTSLIGIIATVIALYAFEPEYSEELGFKKGDILEIIEESKVLEESGWCLARLKRKTQIGLVPLEYFVEPQPQRQTSARTHAPKRPAPKRGGVANISNTGISSRKLHEEVLVPSSKLLEKTVAPDPQGPKHISNIGLSLSIILPILRMIVDFLVAYFQGMFEPPLEDGKHRIRWRCRCGYSSYDDFTELVPGAIDEWEMYLRRRLPSNDEGNSKATTIFPKVLLSLLPASWFKRKGRNNNSDDDDGRRRGTPLPKYSDTSNEVLPASRWRHILLAFPHRRWGSRLSQPVVDKASDREFFQLLQTHYAATKSSLRRRFSMKTIKSISFVQLELYRSGLVDVSAANPMPRDDNTEYEFDPRPPTLIPPVGTNFLVHLMLHPDEADELESPCSSKIPKRRQKLQCLDRGNGLGWGLYFTEGWDLSLLWLLALGLSLLGVTIFFICWSIFRQDVVGAANIAAAITSMMAIFVSSLQVILVIDSV